MIEYPAIPIELRPPVRANINLDRLWFDLCAELVDIEFMGRTHGNSRTYDAGCGGPMCRKAVRVRSRRRRGANAVGTYVWIDPILDLWFEEASKRLAEAQARLLGQILSPPEKQAS